MKKWNTDRMVAIIEAIEKIAIKHREDVEMMRSNPREASVLSYMVWWRVCYPDSQDMKGDLRAYLKYLKTWPKSGAEKRKPGRHPVPIVEQARKMKAEGRSNNYIATRCIRGYKKLDKDLRSEAWRKFKERMDNQTKYRKRKLGEN